MRKILVAGLSLAILMLAGPATAGDVITRDDGAKCITISGEIELDYVTRSSFFEDYYRWRGPSLAHPWGADLNLHQPPIDPVLGPTPIYPGNLFDIGDGRNSNGQDFIDPEITLNFDIELVDNVRGFIQLENRQRDRYPAGLPMAVAHGAPLHGIDYRTGVTQGFPYWGVGEVTERGGDDNITPLVEQAYVEFDGLIEGLRVRTGIQDVVYDLRGNGDAFFIDTGEAEGIGPEIMLPGLIPALQPINTVEFAGITATHTVPDFFGGSFYTDVFLGTLFETGTWEQDQKMVGFAFDWKTETEDPDINNTLRFLTSWFNTNSSNWITSHLIGADWNLVNVAGMGGNLELFMELLLQYGYFASAQDLEAMYPQRFFRDHTDGLAPPTYRGTSWGGSDILTQPAGAARSNNYLPPYSNDMEQKSWGWYFGFQYTQADIDWKPWVEFMYMYLSGDDGGYAGDTGKLFHANEDFVSFEDNDATMIVEENDYGLDIDNNYWKIQVAAGASLDPLFNNDADVDVKLLYAFFEAIDTPFSVRDNIGHEMDLIFTWNYSQDLTFTLAAAWLWDNEIFYDMDFYNPYFHDGPITGIGDDASMLVLGTTLRF